MKYTFYAIEILLAINSCRNMRVIRSQVPVLFAYSKLHESRKDPICGVRVSRLASSWSMYGVSSPYVFQLYQWAYLWVTSALSWSLILMARIELLPNTIMVKRMWLGKRDPCLLLQNVWPSYRAKISRLSLLTLRAHYNLIHIPIQICSFI